MKDRVVLEDYKPEANRGQRDKEYEEKIKKEEAEKAEDDIDNFDK